MSQREGMQEQTLKEKTAKGLFWGGLSNGLVQMLNLVFGIFLARLLTPADYGMVGMLTVFSNLAAALQEGGFISALTNRKDVTHCDYNAVFWFCTGVSLCLYIMLFACAPLIADFYNQPELVKLARVSFIGFVISSMGIAPCAYLFKNLKVKEASMSLFFALIGSGIVGVTLAYNGMAYWGIVFQSLTYVTIVCTLRFWFAHWHPTFTFSVQPIREMIGFSSRLVITNVFNIINANLFSIVLGKYYSEKEVGYYNQASKWNNMGNSTIASMIQGVAQPTLTKLTDDRERQLKVLRKLLRFTAFVSFPALFGLSITSGELITIAITEKWIRSAELMQILCIGGAFVPISTLLSNLIISRGHSNVYMWNTIALSLVQLLAVIVTYRYGIEPMIYAFVGINIGWIAVWVHFVEGEVGLTLSSTLKDMAPYLLLSAALALFCTHATTEMKNTYLRLITKIIIFASLYIGMLWALGSKILKESWGYLIQRFRKRVEMEE